MLFHVELEWVRMVNTREIAAEYRLTHWARVMRERAESGLSIKAFCGQIGICGNTYFYWQRKLREAACSELPLQTRAPEKELVPSGWSRLLPSESHGNPAALTIEVGGCRITADAGTDLELLAKVCHVLKSS